MYENERIRHGEQMAGQIPRPSGKVSSSNPLLKPHMSSTWGGGGLDIDRCIMYMETSKYHHRS